MSKLFCPYCGKELEEDSLFCSYCGARLDNEPEVLPDEPEVLPEEPDAVEEIQEEPVRFEPIIIEEPAHVFTETYPAAGEEPSEEEPSPAEDKKRSINVTAVVAFVLIVAAVVFALIFFKSFSQIIKNRSVDKDADAVTSTDVQIDTAPIYGSIKEDEINWNISGEYYFVDEIVEVYGDAKADTDILYAIDPAGTDHKVYVLGTYEDWALIYASDDGYSEWVQLSKLSDSYVAPAPDPAPADDTWGSPAYTIDTAFAGVYYVNADPNLRVRPQPGLDFDKIANIDFGEQVFVYGVYNNWAAINIVPEGESRVVEAWVSFDYLVDSVSRLGEEVIH